MPVIALPAAPSVAGSHFGTRSEFADMAVPSLRAPDPMVDPLLKSLADEKGFVAAHPQGLNAAELGKPFAENFRSWNAGPCCGVSQAYGVDDVGFIRAVLDLVAEHQGKRPERVGDVSAHFFGRSWLWRGLTNHQVSARVGRRCWPIRAFMVDGCCGRGCMSV